MGSQVLTHNGFQVHNDDEPIELGPPFLISDIDIPIRRSKPQLYNQNIELDHLVQTSCGICAAKPAGGGGLPTAMATHSELITGFRASSSLPQGIAHAWRGTLWEVPLLDV